MHAWNFSAKVAENGNYCIMKWKYTRITNYEWKGWFKVDILLNIVWDQLCVTVENKTTYLIVSINTLKYMRQCN